MNCSAIIFVTYFLLAGIEAPNEEVHIPLETHSSVDRGMCIGVITIINVLQLILGQYITITYPLDFSSEVCQ